MLSTPYARNVGNTFSLYRNFTDAGRNRICFAARPTIYPRPSPQAIAAAVAAAAIRRAQCLRDDTCKNSCIRYRCICIHMTMSKSLVPSLPCFCASLRRASRALTQVYEQALRPLGLRGTQFTILQALSLAGEVPQGELGRILAMDSTT